MQSPGDITAASQQLISFPRRCRIRDCRNRSRAMQFIPERRARTIAPCARLIALSRKQLVWAKFAELVSKKYLLLLTRICYLSREVFVGYWVAKLELGKFEFPKILTKWFNKASPLSQPRLSLFWKVFVDIMFQLSAQLNTRRRSAFHWFNVDFTFSSAIACRAGRRGGRVPKKIKA